MNKDYKRTTVYIPREIYYKLLLYIKTLPITPSVSATVAQFIKKGLSEK